MAEWMQEKCQKQESMCNKDDLRRVPFGIIFILGLVAFLVHGRACAPIIFAQACFSLIELLGIRFD
jgi:hypothetical protein